MKSTLLVLLSVSASFCSTLIYDFAPMETGSKWVYSYIDYNSWMGQSLNLDSFTISIELASKVAKGNDTLVFLNIREQGRSIYSDNTGIIYFDTTSDEKFVDTVIVSPTAITKATGYRCKVFPFWSSHGILIDSLSKGMSGADTLYFLNRSSPDYKISYLQDIGLYAAWLQIITHRHQITSINLISFNDKAISLSAVVNLKPIVQRPLPSGFFFGVITSKQRNDQMAAPCLLNGRKLRTHGIVPGCVYVQKHSTGGK